jgi:hypothetical protein
MATIGVGVSLRGIEHEEFHYPFNLASAITADDVGKPVALDATAANTVKVAGDGDVIVGKLASYENRAIEGVKVGAVALKGGFKFTKSGTVAVGDSVQGAAGGAVKKLTAADYSLNMVVESGSDYVVVRNA